jgi:hypothetical protein
MLYLFDSCTENGKGIIESYFRKLTSIFRFRPSGLFYISINVAPLMFQTVGRTHPTANDPAQSPIRTQNTKTEETRTDIHALA